MKIGALISGGKDSLFAAYKAVQDGKNTKHGFPSEIMRHELVCLGSMGSENPDSYMFHVPNVHLTKMIAEAMKLPLVEGKTMGKKEEELKDLKKLLEKMKKEYGIEGITTGAVASNYQKKRVDNLCAELGLESIAPLWQHEQQQIVQEMIDSGFEIIIVAVAAHGLDESWLGRKLDENALQDMINLNKKCGVSVVGEGGEFETLVVDCPLYRKRIAIKKSEKKWDEKTRSGVLVIKEAELI